MAALGSPPRAVRLSQKYANVKRLVVALATLILLHFVVILGVIVSNTADYLHNGRIVKAQVVSQEPIYGKRPGFRLGLTYVAGGLSNAKVASVSVNEGEKYPVGGDAELRVRLDHPGEAWFGPLEQSDLDQRIAIFVGGLAMGIVITVAILRYLRCSSLSQLDVLANWAVVDSRVKHVGQAGARTTSRSITVAYGYRSYPYTHTFVSEEGISVDSPIKLFVNPDRPEMALPVSSLVYAEVVPETERLG